MGREDLAERGRPWQPGPPNWQPSFSLTLLLIWEAGSRQMFSRNGLQATWLIDTQQVRDTNGAGYSVTMEAVMINLCLTGSLVVKCFLIRIRSFVSFMNGRGMDGQCNWQANNNWTPQYAPWSMGSLQLMWVAVRCCCTASGERSRNYEACSDFSVKWIFWWEWIAYKLLHQDINVCSF